MITNNCNNPVYLDFKGAIPKGFIHIPCGFVYKIAPLASRIEKELDNSRLNFRARHLEKIKEGRTKQIILEYSKAYKERGELYNILGNNKKALSSYLMAIKIDKDDPSLHREIGRTYVVLKRYNEGEKALNTALSINPNYVDAYLTLVLFTLR